MAQAVEAGLVQIAPETSQTGQPKAEPCPDEAVSIRSVQRTARNRVSAELCRRLARLEGRVMCDSDLRLDDIRQPLRSLLTHCRERAAILLSDQPDDPTDGDEDLGLLPVEHQLHNLANDLYRDGHYQEAIACYDMVLLLRDDLLESWFNRALAHTRVGSYEQAEADLNKAIQLNPCLAEVWYTRGLVREYRRNYAEALVDYDKALEIDSTYLKARNQRDAVLRKLRPESENRRSSRRDDGEEECEGRIRDFSPYVSKPDCSLADVGGHQEVKRRLRTIVAYLRGSPVLAEWGAELPRGVLLCGRPGVGKTHLARCLAGEAQCPFYAPPTSVFEDMWAGNTQKNLRRLWDQASQHDCAIIFLDEFDSLGSRRTSVKDPDSWYNRSVGCLLELMDNLAQRSQRVVVVAATNRKENVDPAFLRPGRFSYVIEVQPPTVRELAEIWLIHLERASARASRPDFLDPALDAAVMADRQAWLDRAFRGRGEETSGLVAIARRSAQKGLVGDDVREIVRRTVDERIMAALDCRVDLGPITCEDLARHLEDYQADYADDELDDPTQPDDYV